MTLRRLFKKKTNIPAKKTWQDITLGTFLKIKEFMECKDDYTMLNILSLVYPDVDFEDFTVQDFTRYNNTLDFMNKDIPRNRIKKKYTINGKVYNADFDLTKVNISQFIDYWNYNKKDERKHEELLSVFFVPEGHTYNDGYDIQQVKNDILYLPMPDVQSMIFFFHDTVKRITDSFEILFERRADGTEEGFDGSGQEENGPDYRTAAASRIKDKFNIIPYLLMFCEVTNETLSDTMQMNANFVFYIVSYETLRRKEIERMQKNIIKR